MGSSSDLGIMEAATSILERFDVPYDTEIISAHRTPTRVLEFASTARENGFRVIIAGAGGAAHLPGMVAAHTTLPVIGVPVPTRNLGGQDSLYSIVQMPAGVPVATVSIGGAENAAILALQILSTSNKRIADKLRTFKEQLVNKVWKMNEDLKAQREGRSDPDSGSQKAI
ncbi:MAG: 5-(carboxyamino)imidazole ribonucleotide mutase [Armatimonadetes bacterium]|nr:5-(carboxyamino)imidazole ribonucleotide mutase [Armatimonadota bacterium]